MTTEVLCKYHAKLANAIMKTIDKKNNEKEELNNGRKHDLRERG